MKVDYIKQGDCLELMQELPDQSVHMILCDLPYGVTKNVWDKQIMLDKLWMQYKRIIKPHGVVALFGQGVFFADIVNSNRKWFRYDIVWDKVLVSGFLNANRMPLRCHEQIAIFYKHLPTYNPQFWQGRPIHGSSGLHYRKREINHNYGKFRRISARPAGTTEHYPTSIIHVPKYHPSATTHPTEKPIELLKYLVKTYTNEGDIVLDNCLGCGGTAVACVQTSRHYIGYELMPDYVKTARQRVQEIAIQFKENHDEQ